VFPETATAAPNSSLTVAGGGQHCGALVGEAQSRAEEHINMPGSGAGHRISGSTDHQVGVLVAVQVGERDRAAEPIETALVLADQSELQFGQHLDAAVGEVQVDGTTLVVADQVEVGYPDGDRSEGVQGRGGGRRAEISPGLSRG
jgi:hypothetical protein